MKSVASELMVSEATVRRLFARLEAEHHVIRVHGGVQLIDQSSRFYLYELAEQLNHAEKKAIGYAAAQVVVSNDTLFLDSGSTVFRCAESLALRIRIEELSGIVVLTNSLSIADFLASCCKVILAGGEVRLDRRDVCGSIAERTLQLFRVNRAFFGTDGIDLNFGFMTTDERTSHINSIIRERARETYVLADSSKFNRASFVQSGALNAVTQVITDNRISDADLQAYLNAGAAIRVIATADSQDHSFREP